MIFDLRSEKKYIYTEAGEGKPLVLLHGLMGDLSNFEPQIDFFSDNGYKTYCLQLPLYSRSLLKTNVRGLTNYVIRFLRDKIHEPSILVGNSLGGHLGIMTTLKKPKYVSHLVLTGSSGLYEKSIGDTYPNRSNYDYIKKKTQEVFYDPAVATKELVDEVFSVMNNRLKTIRIIHIARSAIKHNLASELHKIHQPTCLIWGKQDIVTPPDVAEEFKCLIPDSELFWIDKCGHSAMMEHPDSFNQLLLDWLKKHNA